MPGRHSLYVNAMAIGLLLGSPGDRCGAADPFVGDVPDVRAGIPARSLKLYDEGRELYNSGNTTVGLSKVEQVANAELTAALAQYAAAEAAYFSQKYDLALKYCDRAIRLDDRVWVFWRFRGGANTGLGDFAAAERDHTREIELNPRNKYAHYYRAVAARQAGGGAGRRHRGVYGLREPGHAADGRRTAARERPVARGPGGGGPAPSICTRGTTRGTCCGP